MRTPRYDVDASTGVLQVVRRRDGAPIGAIPLDAELAAAIVAELNANAAPVVEPSKPKPAPKKKAKPDADSTQPDGDPK
ncbi:MAG: hypothetical protein IJY15_10095 [Thermoguttaceae bacterium]|nr:hypothetical protein [Thermoguttaceae bacterium]